MKIIIINSQPVRSDFSGIVRKEDVRLVEIDKVELYKSFRPGDIIEAEVISLVRNPSYSLIIFSL